MTDPVHPSTQDTVLLGPTRPPVYYGVPLEGFILAVSVAFLCFAWTFHLNTLLQIIIRAVVCLSLAATVLLIMRALTSWEPNWYPILCSWGRTRLRVLFSRATRAYGGTTFRPGPVALRTDKAELRDFAG